MKNQNTKMAHVLLVEDNEGDVLLTLEAFEECKLKIEISVARNGKEALDFLFQQGDFGHSYEPVFYSQEIPHPPIPE